MEMGSQSPWKLPAIDFTKPELKPGTDHWDSVKGQVKQALKEFGCFEALFDKIPLEIRETTFGAAEELFDLPLEIKSRNVSKQPYYGYIGQDARIPFLEGIGFDDAQILENVEAQSRTFWPQGNTSFSKTIQSFAKGLTELSQMIRRMILEIFQVEKYMDEHMESSECIFKIMKYKGPKTSEVQVGLEAHTDMTLVTILCQNEVKGLGLQSSSTEEWIDWIPSKDAFVVIIGESLHAWLNGRLKATYHRVMLTGDKPRYSVGLFTVPKPGYMIKAPEELVDEAHPLLYKPFGYAELLKFVVSHKGRHNRSGLEAYCSVKN